MTQLLLHNATLLLERGPQHGGVLVRDGSIVSVFAQESVPTGIEARDSIDLERSFLGSGLIDIHIHGSAGIDVQATDVDGLNRLSEFLLLQGITGYFATFVPTDETGYRDAIATIEAYTEHQEETRRSDKGLLGARVLGIHFEGPFVNEKRCGALPREHFRGYDGNPQSLDTFVGGSTRLRRLMTVAPEVEGGLELIGELTRNGVGVFIGHSQANRQTLDLAWEAGARHITHFPNALDQLHHRKPGAVGWGLFRDDVSFDCIADYYHVHPFMLRLMYKTKTADQMVLISDAIMPAGLGDGEFTVWGDPIAVRNGRTSLVKETDEDIIAGSVITLRQALRNIIRIGVPIHEAVQMASSVPARVAGVANCGLIREEMLADLVAFDNELTVRLVCLDGKPVFQNT
jgi:N-acetylglucosamine-6-phosphate deacetylase